VGRLGLRLGSEPHVVGRLGSAPRVGAGWLSPRIFVVGRVISGGGELSPRVLSPRIDHSVYSSLIEK